MKKLTTLLLASFALASFAFAADTQNMGATSNMNEENEMHSKTTTESETKTGGKKMKKSTKRQIDRDKNSSEESYEKKVKHDHE